MEKKKKSYIFNLIIIVAVTALSVFYLVKDGVINKDSLSSLTPSSVLAVTAVYVLSMLLWAFANYLAVKPTLGDWSYLKSVNELVYGKLGSSVTPLKSGHFPMRTYCFASYGYSFYNALTALSKCQIIASVASILNYAVIFFISSAKGLTVSVGDITVGLNVVVLVGLIFHSLTVVFVCLLAFIKPLQVFFIKLTAKIKYRGDKEKREEYEKNEGLKYGIYREQITLMLKRFFVYLPAILVYELFMFATSSLPYASYLSVTGASFELNGFLTFYLLTIAAAYITNVIPIPGAAGSSEVVFGLLFASVVEGGLLGGVMLVWRLGSYYIPAALAVLQFYVSQAIFAAKKRKADGNKDKG